MQKLSQTALGATRAKLSRILSAPVCCTKETTRTSDKEWKIVPAYPSLKGRTLSAAISKLVMRLVRHYDEEERESDGAVHWDTIHPKLLRAFGHQGARDFSEKNWLQHIMKEIAKRSSSTAGIPKIPWHELFELKQISGTTQCHSCLKHEPE